MLKLLNVIEKNYPEIYQHGERVSKVLSLFLEYAGINRKIIEQAALAAKICDVGKTLLPIEILKKEKEGIPLSQEEKECLKKHPKLGLEVINKYYKKNYDTEIIVSGILSHHERYDGKGYPNGLKKYANYQTTYVIALISQIDNLVKRESFSINEALDKIDKDHGNVDPYWVTMFRGFLRNKSNRKKVEEILG